MQHGQSLDPNHGLLATIRRVEVRGRMVIEVHSYDDPVESAEFRHPRPERVSLASRPRRTSR